MWLEICSLLHWRAHLVLLWLLGVCIGGSLIKDNDKSVSRVVGLVASETTSFHLPTFSSSEDDGGRSSSGDVSPFPQGGFRHSSNKKHHNHHHRPNQHEQHHHLHVNHKKRHAHHTQEDFNDNYNHHYDFVDDTSSFGVSSTEEEEPEQTFLFEQVSPENPGEPGIMVVHEKLRSTKGTSSGGGGMHSTSSGVVGGGSVSGIGSSSGLDHHHLHQKHQNSPSDDYNEENGNFFAESGASSGGAAGGGSSDAGFTGEGSGESASPQVGVIREQQEKLLLQQLMRGYERDVRPVRNASHAVVVQVGITLTQIFDMDEKNQVLTTNVWLDQKWNDELLQWDPKDFSNLEVIRIPCERIWLPDIVLYNKYADDYTRGYMPSRAMVEFNGDVFWPPPTKFRSTCGVDVTYFPFDDQTCTLKLGSWTYNGYQVDVTKLKDEIDLTNYVTNGEWDLLRADLKRNVVVYPCCPEPFPDVTVTLVIRRKTLYYIYNIVLPCMMLSALTLLVFCLPPDSGEKIALGITVLLAFSVFMLAISEALPETSESIPLIGIYLTAVMAITSISVIVTVVVLNLHYLGPRIRPVPTWLKCLLPEDDVNFIRQKSLLIPATHRQPRSGSLKRNLVYMPPNLGESGQPDKHSAYDASATTAGVAGDDGIIECSSTESVNNERKPTSGAAPRGPPSYENAVDSREARRRHHHQPSATKQNTSTGGNVGGGGGPAQAPPASHNNSAAAPAVSSASSATTIAAAAIAAATRGSSGSGAHTRFPLQAHNSPGAATSASSGDSMCEDLVNAVRYLMSIQEQVESQNVLVAEWRLVAQAVDRILFWIFATMTIVSSTILLLILPLYKRSTYYGPDMDAAENETLYGADVNNTEFNVTGTTDENFIA